MFCGTAASTRELRSSKPIARNMAPTCSVLGPMWRRSKEFGLVVCSRRCMGEITESESRFKSSAQWQQYQVTLLDVVNFDAPAFQQGTQFGQMLMIACLDRAKNVHR